MCVCVRACWAGAGRGRGWGGQLAWFIRRLALDVLGELEVAPLVRVLRAELDRGAEQVGVLVESWRRADRGVGGGRCSAVLGGA